MKPKKLLITTILLILLIPYFVKASVENYTLPQEMKYGNFINGYSKYIVYYSGLDLYIYNDKTNTVEIVYSTDKRIYSNYALGDYVYFWTGEQNAETSFIHCYNVAKKQLEYVHEVNVPNGNTMFVSMSADNFGNVYLINYKEKKAIYEVDKNGNVVGKAAQVNDDLPVTSINAITPDGKNILSTINFGSEGYIKMPNGDINSALFYFIRYYRAPNWTFINDKLTINQYGEVAEYDTSDGWSYTLKIGGNAENMYSYPVYLCEGNSIYIPTSNGEIMEYTLNDYKKKSILKVDDNSKIVHISKDNNYFYILYLKDNTRYVKKISISEKKESQTFNLPTHSAEKHTINQVIRKYKEAQPTFNYSNSIYENNPNLQAPYYEGSLKTGVKNDVLNQINFYRWLSGLNTITINESKMARSQKGALIQAVNNVLTHFPDKPKGMSDDFYTEAYYGVNYKNVAGDTYSGNVSYGSRIDKVIEGFLDDSNNAEDNVGHRLSMLDPFAYAISFGQVTPYAAVSIYYDDKNDNTDSYFAYPTPGYFPHDSLSVNAYWSIWIDKKYTVDSSTEINLIYNGKTYTIKSPQFKYSRSDSAIYFKLPDELKNSITSNGKYISGKKVEVKVKSLGSTGIDRFNLSYSTTFYDMNTKITSLPGDLNDNGEIDLTDVLTILKIHFKTTTPTAYQKEVGDMNSDGKIDLTDVLRLLKEYFNKK